MGYMGKPLISSVSKCRQPADLGSNVTKEGNCRSKTRSISQKPEQENIFFPQKVFTVNQI